MSSIIDVYRQLFGREGTAKGTDIDMAEHGRAGGISTGTPYKGVQEVPLQALVDLTDSDNLYIGEAKPGTLTSQSLWRIVKIEISDELISILYADGDDLFDNKWDDRTSLTYLPE